MTDGAMTDGAAIRVEALTGHALTPHLDALSALRIAVFRDWPYLYDGDVGYERDYLAEFSENPGAIIVAAFDGARMIGAATAAPLCGHTSAFVPLFDAHGLDPACIFYCGESVLLGDYRGRGLGHTFFDLREAHAYALNDRALNTPDAFTGPARAATMPRQRFTHSVFCGILRAALDPRQPVNYRPLDAFWRKRGYQPLAGLVGTLAWREVEQPGDRTVEIDHQMQFWSKPI